MRQAVLCLVVVAACNDPIVDADGGGSTADTTTDVEPSDAESSTTRSTSSLPDTGAPVDVGTALPPDAELCPAPDAEGIGVDTRMRIAFDSEATPELLTDDAMRLTCGG